MRYQSKGEKEGRLEVRSRKSLLRRGMRAYECDGVVVLTKGEGERGVRGNPRTTHHPHSPCNCLCYLSPFDKYVLCRVVDLTPPHQLQKVFQSPQHLSAYTAKVAASDPV